MEILIGWWNDTYTDENGAAVPFSERICGVLEDEVFKCVSILDFMTFEMQKEEFLSKVTGIKKGAEIWN